MENKKETKEEQPIENYNELKIGTINLISSEQSMESLCNFLVSLLENKEILKYLEILKEQSERSNSSYYD